MYGASSGAACSPCVRSFSISLPELVLFMATGPAAVGQGEMEVIMEMEAVKEGARARDMVMKVARAGGVKRKCSTHIPAVASSK